MTTETQKRKVGASKGNRNALKGEHAATDLLRMRAVPQHKERWIEATEAEGYKNLSSWVTDALNAHASRILD